MRPYLLAALLIVSLLAVAGCGDGNGPTSEEKVTVTINSKERGGGGGETKQPSLVWATHDDGTEETFKIEDNWLTGDHRSGDVYGRLAVGVEYDCTARGYRSGLFSSYRNLIDCTVTGN